MQLFNPLNFLLERSVQLLTERTLSHWSRPRPSIRSVLFRLSFLLSAQQLPSYTANQANETVLDTNYCHFTSNCSLVLTFRKVPSAPPVPIKRLANNLFHPPHKVICRPRIISNTIPRLITTASHAITLSSFHTNCWRSHDRGRSRSTKSWD